jgi:hypothetical protein
MVRIERGALTAPEVYFDTNAFRDLFRDRHPAWERYLHVAIRRAVRLRRIHLITSVATIEELGAIAHSDWARYRRVTEFVFATIRGGLLLPSGDLLSEELRRGRRLRGREKFALPADQLALRLTCRRRQDIILEGSALARQRARLSAADHRLRIPQVLTDLSAEGRDAQEELLLADATAAERIDRWTRDELLAERIGAEAAEGYPLSAVPTATNFIAVSLARWRWYIDGGKVGAGDNTDAHHYAAAGYADAFVSGDTDLGDVAALVPGRPIRTITMAVFADQYLRP